MENRVYFYVITYVILMYFLSILTVVLKH